GMLKREEVMSTGVGDGIGIPHAAASGVNRAALCLCRLARPMDFSSLDGKPVDVVLAMIVPDGERMLHLQILAGIARLCRNPAFLQAVRTENDPGELLSLICRLEDEMAFH
ncbi:MAG: PTS sugar transporter subunit IIA, partial [Pseudomonadota bacterium]